MGHRARPAGRASAGCRVPWARVAGSRVSVRARGRRRRDHDARREVSRAPPDGPAGSSSGSWRWPASTRARTCRSTCSAASSSAGVWGAWSISSSVRRRSRTRRTRVATCLNADLVVRRRPASGLHGDRHALDEVVAHALVVPGLRRAAARCRPRRSPGTRARARRAPRATRRSSRARRTRRPAARASASRQRPSTPTSTRVIGARPHQARPRSATRPASTNRRRVRKSGMPGRDHERADPHPAHRLARIVVVSPVPVGDGLLVARERLGRPPRSASAT